MLVLVEQTGSEPPVTTHVSVSVLGLDAKMRSSGAYEETSEGRITPTQFVVYSSAPTVITEPHRETIRWRRDDGDWRTFPQAYYADSRGGYEFKVAQKGPYKGLTWGTEHLDELKRGGRFTIARLSEAGEELLTGFIQYPNDGAINSLYKRAKSQAIVASSQVARRHHSYRPRLPTNPFPTAHDSERWLEHLENRVFNVSEFGDWG